MRVDHEPDQTAVENMQRDEKLWRSRRMFSDASAVQGDRQRAPTT